MTDLIDRTARQVYIDDQPPGEKHRVVHDVVGPPRTANDGRRYNTRCRQVLTSFEGAVLTTQQTSCTRCLDGGRDRVMRGG